jgi:hypothetical protein
VVTALDPEQVDHVRSTREDEYFPLAAPVRRRLGALHAEGALPPAMRDAFGHDRTTSADDLLRLIERDGLAGSLAGSAVRPPRTPAVGVARWAS